MEGRRKAVSSLIFDGESFKRYLVGELVSVARSTELAIYDPRKIVREESDGDEEDGEDEDEEE